MALALAGVVVVLAALGAGVMVVAKGRQAPRSTSETTTGAAQVGSVAPSSAPTPLEERHDGPTVANNGDDPADNYPTLSNNDNDNAPQPTPNPTLQPQQTLKPTPGTNAPTGPTSTNSPTPPTRPTTARPTSKPTSRPTASPTLLPRANVLLIIADDFKPAATSFTRSPVSPPTPNIDSIAARGVRFLNAHAQISLCGPSRASFLTSLRPDNIGVYGLDRNELGNKITTRERVTNRAVMTLPRLFKSYGFGTYAVGKVFHESEWALMQDPDLWTVPVYSWQNFPPSFQTPYQGSWIASPDNVPDTFFADGQVAVFAASLITSLAAKPTKPWFLAVGFYKPHLPWAAPGRYFRAQKVMSAFPGAFETQPTTGLALSDYNMIRGGGCGEVSLYPGPTNLASWDLTMSQEQAATQAYLATVSYMDAQVGVVLRALNATDPRVSQNTHVVFLGDHGFHLGDRGIWCKHTNYEAGTRTALIFAPALSFSSFRVARGRSSVAPVELLDLMPTLADLSSIPKTDADWFPWDGVSLARALAAPDTTFVKAAAVSQYWRGAGQSKVWGYSLRTVRYRFTAWCPAQMQFNPSFGQCVEELYDYFANRYESTSLAVSNAALRGTFQTNAGVPGFSWVGVRRFDVLAGAAPMDWGSAAASRAAYFEELPDYP